MRTPSNPDKRSVARPAAARSCAGQVIVTALALLAACIQPAVAQSPAQARVCRSLLVVLNPGDARIKVVSTGPVGREDGVVLSYDVTLPPTRANAQRTRNRRLMCTFSKRRSGGDELLMVASDGRLLGVPRLAFLKRYWLRSPEANRVDELLDASPAR